MAAKNCPKCKENFFTWFLNDKTNLKSWSCFSCDYEAKQTENDEHVCEKCNEKSKKKLKDKEIEYFWCSNCNATNDL